MQREFVYVLEIHADSFTSVRQMICKRAWAITTEPPTPPEIHPQKCPVDAGVV
jgi:hypothetical protein